MTLTAPIAALALLALAPAPSFAQGANAAGIGLTLCADAAPLLEQRPYRDAFRSWMLGFASGLNAMAVARDRRFRDLSGLDADEPTRALRGFCTDNPTAMAVQAAERFWLALPLRDWAQTPRYFDAPRDR